MNFHSIICGIQHSATTAKYTRRVRSHGPNLLKKDLSRTSKTNGENTKNISCHRLRASSPPNSPSSAQPRQSVLSRMSHQQAKKRLEQKNVDAWDICESE